MNSRLQSICLCCFFIGFSEFVAADLNESEQKKAAEKIYNNAILKHEMDTFQVSAKEAKERIRIRKEAATLANIVDSNEDISAGMIIDGVSGFKVTYQLKRSPMCPDLSRIEDFHRRHSSRHCRETADLLKRLQDKDWKDKVTVELVDYSQLDLRYFQSQVMDYFDQHDNLNFTTLGANTFINKVSVRMFEPDTYYQQMKADNLDVPSWISIEQADTPYFNFQSRKSPNSMGGVKVNKNTRKALKEFLKKQD